MTRIKRSFLFIGVILWLALGSPILAAPPHQGEHTYIVQAGDTLAQIALRFGVSVRHLNAVNNLADPNHILVGQRLVIPSGWPTPSEPQVHMIRSGETLVRIAHQHRVSITDLIAVNELVNPDHILAGQRLTIPSELTIPGQVRSTQEVGLPASLTDIHITPNPALQGQTVTIHVQANNIPPEATIHGTLLDQSFSFSTDDPKNGSRWALIGIPTLTDPGQYELQLTTEGYTPEVLTSLTILPGRFSTDYIQLSSEVSQLLDPILIQREWVKLNQYWSYLHPQRLWRGPFDFPITKDTEVSSPFGTRRSYNGKPARSYHEGIDFARLAGTPIYAPAAGRVVLAEALTVRGKGVLIDHGWGVVSGYFHLSHIEVEAGQSIESGDLIGQVGSTGLSTGNHLHWEIRVRSVPVDPRQWTLQTIPH